MQKEFSCFIDKIKDDNKEFVEHWNYCDIVNYLCDEICVEVRDSDYEGDTRMLIRQGDIYGVLIFGWGSCSGCDALQGCSSVDDYINLADRLYNDIIWKESKEEMFLFIANRDWEGQAIYSKKEETEEFIEKSLIFLKPNLKPLV